MKTLPQLGRELQISVSTLITYFQAIGKLEINLQSKIDPNLEKEITYRIHRGDFNIKPVSSVLVKEGRYKTPKSFEISHPFKELQRESVYSENKFDTKETRTVHYGDEEIQTIFSDFEACSVCLGLIDSNAKRMAREFFKSNQLSPSDEISVHRTAMAALTKYGHKMIRYVMSLPPLPFNALNATNIFSEIDKRIAKQNYPVLRITFRNNNNQVEKIHISYLSDYSDKTPTKNYNILQVKNSTTGQKLMQISRSGDVVPDKDAKNIIPILQLFVQFSKNTKSYILSYGHQTGECSVCGRELVDLESIKLGIGPRCRQYL